MLRPNRPPASRTALAAPREKKTKKTTLLPLTEAPVQSRDARTAAPPAGARNPLILLVDARVEADPWEALLAAWTAERGTFSMDDVLGDALGLRTSSLSSHVTTRVSRLLSRLGFERRRRTRLPRVYEYVRVDVQPSPRPGGRAQTARTRRSWSPCAPGWM